MSLAGVAVLQNGRQVVEFQKKFNEDPKLEAYSMAVPLAAGQTRYTRVGYQVLATPLAVTGGEPGKRYYLMLVMNTASIDRELRLSALMMVLLGLAMVGRRASAPPWRSPAPSSNPWRSSTGACGTSPKAKAT